MKENIWIFEKRKNMSDEYCKSILKMKNVKKCFFVRVFSDISVLEKVFMNIREYLRYEKMKKQFMIY